MAESEFRDDVGCTSSEQEYHALFWPVYFQGYSYRPRSLKLDLPPLEIIGSFVIDSTLNVK